MKMPLRSTLFDDVFGQLNGTPKLRNYEEERELILKLRHRMRMEMLLPPLNAQERDNWKWEETTPLREYRYTGPQRLNGQPRLKSAQTHAIASYIRSRYPEVLRYLESVRSHNEPLGHNDGLNDHYIVRQAWHHRLVLDAVCEIVGDHGEIYVEVWQIEQALVPGWG
jgi:hypothetical protein